MLPNELKIYIYEYCCSPTKVLLNKVFKWNFYAFNPLQNLPITNKPKGIYIYSFALSPVGLNFWY